MQSPDYLHFWGKARGQLPDDLLTWHPLAYHCLDVAVVADELLRQNPRRLAAMASLAGTADVDGFRSFIVAMIALHDIGKFASTFQAKSEGAWPAVVLGPYPVNPKTDGDHALLASRARLVLDMKSAFREWTEGWDWEPFDCLWHAVSGHHGLPKVTQPATDPRDMQGAFPAPAVAAASAFRDDVLALFPTRTHLPEPNQADRRLAQLSWALAGLTVLADWVGSRRDWFAYEQPEHSLAHYWPCAQSKATAAVMKAGILPAAVNSGLQIEQLLPEGRAPSPLQRSLAKFALPDGPLLTIVEDVTGSGKTEAALMLAARLIQDGRAAGLFFALPTMATANAMYDRMRDKYRLVFSSEVSPSLVLAHGKRALNDRFQGSILGIDEPPPETTGGDHEDDATAICTAWLADDRRKALLAHVGVGTIDQALLGVLPSKFQALRLWGMTDRVLVLDEVHAFDAYMSREISALLEFQAALGGSAILLSATLPARQRTELAAAFRRGLGLSDGAAIANDAPTLYPLITLVAKAQTTIETPATRDDRTRSVAVRRIGSVQEAVAHVADVAANGGCIAWIRNSVDDAIEAVDMVREYDRTITPILLHARFAMGDRLEIESKVRATLGPGDNPARQRFVLIGTQILEASLDYDVDAMITDIAPIDLVIQRAGRLWRHSDRGGRPLPTPELLILSAEPTKDADADWYKAVSKRAPWVYQHHGIVWRSAAKLFAEKTISTPGGVRDLVEAVYGPERDEVGDVPLGLQRASLDAFGKDMAAQTFAHGNLLKLSEGYAGQRNAWTQDTVTPTRLGDPVTVFRFGRWEGDRIVPYYGDCPTIRNWALSEVSVSQKKAIGVLPSGSVTERAICAAKVPWPKWERDMPLLVLTASGRDWAGTVTKDGTTAIEAHYNKVTGFRLL
jgi:CRISPR-associated endonuclease/helicase Cas3